MAVPLKSESSSPLANPGGADRPAEPEGTRPVNILIVDDEARNLDVLESILYQPGYRLVRAGSANEALLALMDGDFALLVLDINMPVTNGLELANLIKQRKRTQHIPILFLTAYYQEEKYVLEGYEVGAVDYLTKPVNPVVLRAKVAVFVDLHRMNLALAAGNAALAREVAQRQQAEASLASANQELETRVLQRTAELQASEGELRLVADHASVYLAHFDRQHRFRFVNRAYAERLGRRPDQIVGAELAMVMGAGFYSACRLPLERALAGERTECEMEVPDPLGGWWQMVYEPERSATTEVSGVVAVFSDITARKRAEQAMARAHAETLAASRAKDDFLAALSHELRTPLSPVMLIASAGAVNPELTAEVRDDFSCIAKNARLEARLIDDLLDLTRITRGKLTLDLKPVDVQTVLEDALLTVSVDVREKNIALRLEPDAARPVARVDAARLQQVFWNVLQNAVKFSHARGNIVVALRAAPGSGELTVTVTDEGIGMTPEEIARIFQPFVQGDHATGGSHRFGGLGLGLAISQMLLRMHGGSLQAFSAGRNKGAAVVIRLPLTTDAAAGSGPAPERAASKLAPRAKGAAWQHPILLVEDHDATRSVLANLMNQRNIPTVVADSVAAALQVAAAQKLSFVISDIGLPDGSGYDLMILLRDRHGLKGVALSGYGMEKDVARSRDSGFIDHLTKPVSFDMIERLLEKLAAGL